MIISDLLRLTLLRFNFCVVGKTVGLCLEQLLGLGTNREIIMGILRG